MRTLVIAFSFAGMLMAADPPQSFTGVITDTMCGAKHDMMKGSPDDECVKVCVKGSSDYALYDGKDVWKLNDQTKASQFPAKKVIVTGTPNSSTKTIKVVSIEPVK
ncbi:MAG: hypothetical protein ACR2IV_02485 [Bryobacteraceae bacterium]